MSSSPIGPGDYVECIDDSPHRWGVPSGLSTRAVYVVHSIMEEPDVNGSYGVVIAGHFYPPRMNLRRAHRASRFRPIYRPSASLIEDLMKVDELMLSEIEGAIFEAVMDANR